MNLDGTTKTQVAEHVSIDSELAFASSPDGGQLVYVDGGGISVVNVDGSGTKRLVVHSGYGEYATAWSPDGRTIAFVRSTGPRRLQRGTSGGPRVAWWTRMEAIGDPAWGSRLARLVAKL
jgi:Tol biopolymer transport system component